MVALHEKKIEHRDLKAENCLVEVKHGQYRAKIADFGLSKSKALVTHSTSRNFSGTRTHQAPEILLPPEGATERSDEDRQKSDVYSYGIVMYEVLSRKKPFQELTDETHIVVAVVHGRRPSPIPSDIPPKLVKLMEQCWEHDTARRPNFQTIVPEVDDVFYHEVPLESIEEEPFAEGGFGSVHRGMYVIAIASTCITHCRY